MRSPTRTGARRGSAAAQRGPEPVGIDPPEVVLAPVDERHRDLLGEAVVQRRVGVDVDLGERLAQLGADRLDDGAGVVAQVAARRGRRASPAARRAPAGHSRSPSARRRSMPRSRPFCTLPVTVSGSSSTTSIRLGCLKRASRAAACSAHGVGEAVAGIAVVRDDVGDDGLAGLVVRDADDGRVADARHLAR